MLIPVDNAKDLADVPGNVKEGLEIIPVSTIDEVLDHALTDTLEPIEWTAADEEQLGGLVFQQPPAEGARAH